MENYIKQTKSTCAKHRFAPGADKLALTFCHKFDMLIMLGGRMAVLFYYPSEQPDPADGCQGRRVGKLSCKREVTLDASANHSDGQGLLH